MSALRGIQQFKVPTCPTLQSLANLPLPKKLLLALTAGLLNWAVFPKVGLWPLVWICQVPLMLASFRETSSSALAALRCLPLVLSFFSELATGLPACCSTTVDCLG